MRYLREWLAITLMAALVIGSFTLTYGFGTQAHSDRLKAQSERLKTQAAQIALVQATLHHQCLHDQDTWNTFQRVIGAATNPPAEAGRQLTVEQVAALAAWREGMIVSVGPKPICN